MDKYPANTLMSILRRVNKSSVNGCWNWTGSKDNDGYGKIVIGLKHFRVHRVVWEITNDSTAGNRVVMHLCDNPSCCNPEHLSVGTVQDNRADCVAKKRQAKHELAHTAKLSIENVEEIKALYATGNISQMRLATIYNVNQTTISHIIRGETWR